MRKYMSQILFTVLMLFAIGCYANAEGPFYNNTDNAAITAKVKSALVVDPVTSAYDIKVTTRRKIVHLSGVVDTDAQATRAIEISQSVQGVRDVKARFLTVRQSTQPFSDLMITAKVRGLYLRERLFGDADISAFSIGVSTNNGIVSLTGTAANADQVRTAIKLARLVSGVRYVESYVSIR